MNLLFTVMALIEGAAGIALLVVPSAAVSMLLGVPLDTPAGLVVGRIAGAALVALGLSCWGARRDEHNRAANGIVSAMLLYNVAAAVVLAHAGLGWRLTGVGLWPAVVLHALLGVWCLACKKTVFTTSITVFAFLLLLAATASAQGTIGSGQQTAFDTLRPARL